MNRWLQTSSYLRHPCPGSYLYLILRNFVMEARARPAMAQRCN
ncbi:MAG: hypothetical protein ACTSRA_13180 [Promethearchaeota archaeon]